MRMNDIFGCLFHHKLCPYKPKVVAPCLWLVHILCCRYSSCYRYSPLPIWKWRCWYIWRSQICRVGCECDCIISTKIGMVWTQLHSVRRAWWTYQTSGIYISNRDSDKTEALQHLSGRQGLVPFIGPQWTGWRLGLLHTECQRWGQIYNEVSVYPILLHYKSRFRFLELKFENIV
jgi:hypothetical protein